jgi:hypothetical protein
MSIERRKLWQAYVEYPDLFIESCWHIRVPRKNPALMKLWDAQREILDIYQSGAEKIVSLKARQLGWTTTTSAYAFHSAFFHEYTPWLFISQNEDYAKKNLGFVKFAWPKLPQWLVESGPEILVNNSETMEWANGSRIESIPATVSAGRGTAVYGVMWDEGAFAPDFDNQMAAIEPLVYGQLILLSTANGMGNPFHNIYLDSKQPGSEWVSAFFPWSARPDRDQDWYDRKKRAMRGKPWQLHQEYPRNDMEAFAKSGRTAIDPEVLEDFLFVAPESRHPWRLEGFDLSTTLDVWDDSEPIVLDVWEPPTIERDPRHGYALRDPNYVVFCDLAEGIIEGDATVVVVYDVNYRTCVARMQTYAPIEMMPEIIDWIGRWYFNALLGVERNQHGWGVLHHLDNVLRYPRLFSMPSIASKQRTRSQLLGWHTNQATKPKMIVDFATELRSHGIDPRDPKLAFELATFVQRENGTYGASAGSHDDVAMAHMGAVQLMNDSFRFPIVWRDNEYRQYTTMGELDDIAFGAVRAKPVPIGQSPNRSVVKSFWVTPK